MSSRCPVVAEYPDRFNPRARPYLVAAMLSARPVGGQWIIEPPTGEVWFYRDANELVGRGWGQRHQMRVDRNWTYRLTPDGVRQRERLWAGVTRSQES